MATLVVTPANRLGTLDLTSLEASASGGGDLMPNDGATYLYVRNASGADHTVTAAFASTAKLDGISPTPRAVTVTAGHTAILGPYDTNLYNNAQGQVAFTYSAVTTTTVAAFSRGAI